MQLRAAVAFLVACAAAVAVVPNTGVGAQAEPQQGPVGQSHTDYDADNDNLIEVSTRAQLNAIRWDLDGNGTAESSATSYAGAFPHAASGMGCAATCTGYELSADINLGGARWSAIGDRFTATFEGNDRLIYDLSYEHTDYGGGVGYGLFRHLGSAAQVRNLRLVAPYVKQNIGSVISSYEIGALAATNAGTITDVEVVDGYVGAHAAGSSASQSSWLWIGGLVAKNTGTITSSSFSGRVNAPSRRGVIRAGGLVGEMTGSGSVTGSFADVDLDVGSTASGWNVTAWAGGLVGDMASTGSIDDSYARGSVNASWTGVSGAAGGLVGRSAGSIDASFTHATVSGDGASGTDTTCGLSGGSGAANSYYDSTVQTSNVGTCTGSGKTTSALQGPTSRSGIYGSWTASSWDFGTSSQYPALKEGGLTAASQRQSLGQVTGVSTTAAPTTVAVSWTAVTGAAGYVVEHKSGNQNYDRTRRTRVIGQSAATATVTGLTNGTAYTISVYAFGSSPHGARSADAGATPGTDYDTDDDQLVEVDSLAKLNAIRWDLDGDGTSTNAGHATAFPSAASALGCPGECKGYELTASLDFDTGTAGDRTDDTYWNSGAGWTPIGPYTGTFDGARSSYTISNLYIDTASGTGDVGLFSSLGAGASVSDVALEDVDIRGAGGNVGAVAGKVGAATGSKAVVSDSYSTGSIAIASGGVGNDLSVGGIAGRIETTGEVTRSYSWAWVTAHNTNAAAARRVLVGGVVGYSVGRLWISFSRGRVAGHGTGANQVYVGGVIGGLNGGDIRAIYATGHVVADGGGTTYAGGLLGGAWGTSNLFYHGHFIGRAKVTNPGATNSRGGAIGLIPSGWASCPSVNPGRCIEEVYWDTGRTGIDDDGGSAPPEGKRSYLFNVVVPSQGIFAFWNRGSRGYGDPWDGGNTTSEPPFFKTSIFGGTKADQLDGPRGKVGGVTVAIDTNSTTSTKADDKLDVTWNTVSGAESYRVQWRANDSLFTPGGEKIVTGQASNSYEIPAADIYVGPTWSVRVVAMASGRPDGEPSDEASVALGLDYDADDDGYVDVDSLAKLSSLRYDLNTDGTVAAADKAGFGLGYPDALTGMGCPSTGCLGYELTASLDFDTDGDGTADSGDDYWNGGQGWLPIGQGSSFTGVLEGNSNTLSNLYVKRTSSATVHDGGLFGSLGSTAEVRNLTLSGVSVSQTGGTTGTVSAANAGALAGTSEGTVTDVSASGTVTAATPVFSGGRAQPPTAGGLVGRQSGGVISDSFSTASVTAAQGDTDNAVLAYGGGLVGRKQGGTIESSWASSPGVVASVNAATRDAQASAGGLVGLHEGGTTQAVYALGIATAQSSGNTGQHSISYAGGLVGQHKGGQVRVAYANATAVAENKGTAAGYLPQLNAGGLAGLLNGGTIVASYAAGTPVLARGIDSSNDPFPITTNTVRGGLVAKRTSGTTTDSYWDTTISGINTAGQGTGLSTSELQTPTAYGTLSTDIYADWDIDLDAVTSGTQDGWSFGTSTQYPVLTYGGLTAAPQRPQLSLTMNPVGGSNTALSARWTVDAGVSASGFRLEWRTEAEGSAWSSHVVSSGTDRRYTITGLNVGTAYDVRVALRRTDGGYGPPTAIVSATTGSNKDYDIDDDGLIEISTLAQLNAVRWDLDGNGTAVAGKTTEYVEAFPKPLTGMGCPSNTCTGYELDDHLDFDTDNSGAPNTGDDYWDSGRGWLPIGATAGATASTAYSGDFDGNSYVISNLFVNRSAAATTVAHGGLFARIASGAEVSDVHLEGVSVTVSLDSGTNTIADVYVGAVAGRNAGDISGSYATGTVKATQTDAKHAYAGGLVGESSGSIEGSYARATVTAHQASTANSLVGYAGGIAGRLASGGTVQAAFSDGSVTARSDSTSTGLAYAGGLAGYSQGALKASYSHAAAAAVTSATAQSAVLTAGGLVGHQKGGSIAASYATGAPSSSGGATPTVRTGGLAGHTESTPTVTNSYWDATRSSQSTSAAGTSKTTSQLQTPTAYGTGSAVYAGWNLNLDGVTGNDDPWDFGTASQYPVLDYGGLGPADQRASVTLAISPATICESPRGTGGKVCGAMPVTSATITATLSPARQTDVTVTLTDANNTSTQAAAIYTLSSATLTIAAGATTATATVSAVNNSVEAADKVVQWNAAASDPQVGFSAASVSLTITDEDSVAAPRARASGAKTPNDEVTVSWTAVTGADGYYVQWKSGAQEWSSTRQHTVTGGSTVTHTEDGLTANTQHTFRVIAYRTGFDNSAPSNEVRATPGKVTYDADYDGLIEISSAAQLNAVRWDLDGDGTAASGKASQYATAFPDADTGMGCPSAGCDGYELSTDIDLDTDGDGTADSGDAYWNNGAGWTPIGAWAAEFDGNLHEVQNLFVNSSASAAANVGLFSEVAASGEVRRLGVTAASVTAATSSGDIWVGILAGKNSGTVLASWTTGAVTARSTASASSAPGAGGLVGWNTKTVRGAYSNAAATATANGTSNSWAGGLAAFNDSGGRVEASHATGAALANGTPVSNTLSVRSTAGGLLARNKGEATAAYAAGNATALGLDATAGGLVGSNETRDLSAQTGGQIIAAYAVGTPSATAGASGTAYTGGLVARNQLHATASDSYWDSAASGTTSSAVGTAKTTSQLQTPTAYGTGSAVYANWNLNVDGISGTDDPWDFGTSSQYPLLSWGALHGDIADATLPTLSWAASRTTICESTKGTAATACNLSPAHNTSVLTPTLSAAFDYDVVFSLTADATLYTLSADTVTIPAGDTTATGVTLTAVNNKADVGEGAAPTVTLTPRSSHVWLTASVPDITIADDDELAAPTGLRLSVGPVTAGTHKLRVDWNAVPGSGISYLVEWNTAQDTGWDSPTGSATASTNSHTVTGLTAGTDYWVRVTAQGTGFDDSLPSSLASTVSGTDYDTDDDGLIEITSQAQLSAIRWDVNGDGAADSALTESSYTSAFPGAEPNMGCGELVIASSSRSPGNPACSGYELKNGITLTGLGSNGWVPIPGWDAVLEGNGFTISGLTISQSGSAAHSHAGFFAGINSGGVVRNLGLVGVSITAKVDSGSSSRFSIYGGAVAGRNAGLISGSYASGTVTVTQDYGGGAAEHAYAGGLVGENSGRIRSSYARVTVTASQRRTQAAAAAYAGGIAARQSTGGSIVASFSSGSVAASTKAASGGLAYAGGLLGYQAAGAVSAAYSYADPSVSADAAATGATLTAGGLVGHLEGGSIAAAYATGAPAHGGGVSPTVRTGGLAGHRKATGTTVTNSYWDSERSGITAAGAGVAKTGTQLRSPTAYGVSPGIYSGWNLDLDDQAGADDPWDFGTAAQYPVLKFGLAAASQRATVTLSVSPAAICESASGSAPAACGASPVTSATVSAAVSPVQLVPVTVDVAGAVGQYTVSGTAVTIAAGATAGSSTATVTAVNNSTFAADTAVTVAGTPAQEWVTVAGASLTIRNDDLAPPVASLVPQSSLTSVGVSWAAVANAGGYRVEWNTSATDGWATPTGTHTLSGGASVSHTITGLTASQTYWVRVIATGTGWESSAPSSVLTFGVPAAPAAPQLASGIASLTATWAAPAANGSALVDYDVQHRACSTSDTSCATDPAWGAWADRSGETAADTALSASLGGLRRGVAYQVRVRAANGKGEGAWSQPSAAVQVRGAPGRPGNISGTWDSQTPTTLDVSWVSPGDAYLAYDVRYRTDTDSVWAANRSYPPSGWTAVMGWPQAATTSISSLDAASTYVVAVRARSRLSGLYGGWTISGLIEPADTPARPGPLAESARSATSLTVGWPLVSGAAGGYEVRAALASAPSSWASVLAVAQPSSGTQVSAVLPTANLPVGSGASSTYVVQVRSKSASGTCGSGGVKCSRWVASGQLAQLDISGLSAVKNRNGGDPSHVRTDRLDVDVTWDALPSSLSDVSYELRFRWRNGQPSRFYDGSTGRPSGWVQDWQWWTLCNDGDASNNPSGPQDTGDVDGDGDVTECLDPYHRTPPYLEPVWAFGPPEWGSVVTVADSANCSGSGSARTCSYTFADATVSYLTDKVQIRAVVGAGQSAQYGPRTYFTTSPVRAPGRPYGLSVAAPTGSSVKATWSVPYDNGSAITGYDLQLVDVATGRASTTVTGTKGTPAPPIPGDGSTRLSYTFSGVTSNKTYTVSVRAVNAKGKGNWRRSGNIALTPTAPPAPARPTVSVSGTTATLTWAAPSDDGGAAVTAYKVQYRKQNADSTWPSTWTDHTRTGTGASTTESVGGLTAASTYEFRVLAVNSVGDGAWSVPVEDTTP